MSTCANVRPLCKPENSVKRKVGPKGSHVALLKTAECFHGSQNFRERSSILGPFSVNCNFFSDFPQTEIALLVQARELSLKR